MKLPFAIGCAASLTAFASQPGFASPPSPLPMPSSFAICSACHSVEPSGAQKIGPSLWGISCRKAGSTKYNYSRAMKNYGAIWDKSTLSTFIIAPQKTVLGTKMPFQGESDEIKVKQIVNYLLSLR